MIAPPPRTFMQLEERMTQLQENRNGMNWYLTFQAPSHTEGERAICDKDSSKKE